MSRKSRVRPGFDADDAVDTLLMAQVLQAGPRPPAEPESGARPRDIAELTARATKATLDCDAWRAAGLTEKYLEAYSLKEALEVEIAALVVVQGRARTRQRSNSPAGPDVPEPAARAMGTREQLMADLSIAYDGIRYYYDRYRYDRLDDAVDYATLQRFRSTGRGRMPMPAPEAVEGPDERERLTMASYGITYVAGTYWLAEYRYDRLDDAVAYARLRHIGPP